MSPDPLLALIVDAIRRGGRARQLIRDHAADHTQHCPRCAQRSPCTIFSAALLAFESPDALRVVADRPPRNRS